jgi:hypothetical protein
VKYCGLIAEQPFKLHGLRELEEDGIPGVRVKSVDIGKNTNGEGNLLGFF